MSEWFRIFISFFKVGLFTFGGGAAMIPFFRVELIEKNKYITENELMGYYALGQCTPGIIAVNVATFTGYKIKGVLGACLATFAIILPSLIIIMLIASALQMISDNVIVSHIFAGVRIGVVALVFNEVVKLFSRNAVSLYQKCIFFSIAVIIFSVHLSPIAAILLAAMVGVVKFLKERKK